MEFKKKLAKKAMQIWCRGFQPPRKGSFHFASEAAKRKRMKLAPKSLKAWIQGRRKDVASLALTTKRSLSSLSAGDEDLDQESLRKRARSLAGDSFGSAHQKAAAKLDAKARARQYEAQRSNQLVASETVPEKEFQTMLEKQRSNDIKAKRKHAHISASCVNTAKTLKELAHGQQCFLLSSQSDRIHDALIKNGAENTDDIFASSLFVASNVMEPGQRATWNALFRPGMTTILSSDMVLAQSGPWLQIWPSLSTACNVWCSDDFTKHHASIVRILGHYLKTHRDKKTLIINFNRHFLGS